MSIVLQISQKASGQIKKTAIKFIWFGTVAFTYHISIKIRAPLNFAPLIFAHPLISRHFNFGARLFYCKFAVLSFIRDIFLLSLIFARSYCGNLLPLIFALTRCAKIKGSQILMGIRQCLFFLQSRWQHLKEKT